MTKEPTFAPVETISYKDGIFQGGLVKNSPHPVDKIYLRIKDYFFHLRSDEAYAIIVCLTKALWTEKLGRMHKYKFKFKKLKHIV